MIPLLLLHFSLLGSGETLKGLQRLPSNSEYKSISGAWIPGAVAPLLPLTDALARHIRSRVAIMMMASSEQLSQPTASAALRLTIESLYMDSSLAACAVHVVVRGRRSPQHIAVIEEGARDLTALASITFIESAQNLTRLIATKYALFIPMAKAFTTPTDMYTCRFAMDNSALAGIVMGLDVASVTSYKDIALPEKFRIANFPWGLPPSLWRTAAISDILNGHLEYPVVTARSLPSIPPKGVWIHSASYASLSAAQLADHAWPRLRLVFDRTSRRQQELGRRQVKTMGVSLCGPFQNDSFSCGKSWDCRRAVPVDPLLFVYSDPISAFVAQKLTIVITSSYTTLKCPRPISNVISSLRLIPVLRHAEILLMYDGMVARASNAEKEDFSEYKNCIRNYVKGLKGSARVRLLEATGKLYPFETLKIALREVKTPFVYVMQDDMPITRPFDVYHVLSSMVKYPDINYVRTTYRLIQAEGFDFVRRNTLHTFTAMLKTNFWNDFNHFGRVSYYINTVLVGDCLEERRRFVEYCFGKRGKSDVEAGTFVLGYFTALPFTTHIDGRAHYTENTTETERAETCVEWYYMSSVLWQELSEPQRPEESLELEIGE